MIRRLSPEILKIRSDFLKRTREFFHARGYIEAEAPLVNPTGGVDPFLDPLRITRSGVRKSAEAKPAPRESYLITSPEYNLKIILADLQAHVFQIAHAFREGDRGKLHTEEFLLLEWYRVGADEFELMNECREFLAHLARGEWSKRSLDSAPPRARSVADVFREYCSCSTERGELEKALVDQGLRGVGEKPEELRYDELFFTLFLNRAEPRLGRGGPEFLYDYPPELAALAAIENGRARRFELYWEGTELANGYYELRSPEEQRKRFERENELRLALGKPRMEIDEQLLQALERGLPPVSGIALGLDRVLMLLLGETSLEEISPFP